MVARRGSDETWVVYVIDKFHDRPEQKELRSLKQTRFSRDNLRGHALVEYDQQQHFADVRVHDLSAEATLKLDSMTWNGRMFYFVGDPADDDPERTFRGPWSTLAASTRRKLCLAADDQDSKSKEHAVFMLTRFLDFTRGSVSDCDVRCQPDGLFLRVRVEFTSTLAENSLRAQVQRNFDHHSFAGDYNWVISTWTWLE